MYVYEEYVSVFFLLIMCWMESKKITLANLVGCVTVFLWEERQWGCLIVRQFLAL
jgi:hypothetical protein